jgi:uncharacterized protein
MQPAGLLATSQRPWHAVPVASQEIDPALAVRGFSRETTLFRDGEGRWFHDGEPLEHSNLVRAFDRWIERAPDDRSRYCVKNDINWAYITLEGPPFFVRSVSLRSTDGSESPELLLSNDQREPLRADSLRVGPDEALYCDVGAGDMTARFERHAAMQLEPLIGEDGQGIYVRLDGRRVRPPRVDDPLRSLTEPASAPANQPTSQERNS